MYKLCLIFLVVVTCSGCSNKDEICEPTTLIYSGLDIIDKVSLKDSITEYYNYESQLNWTDTYSFRSNEFRKLVSFELYKKNMHESFSDWGMQSMTVLSVQYDNEYNRAEIEIEFLECFGKEAAAKDFGGKISSGVHKSVEKTLWHKVDDNWYTIYPGSRNRIEMNNAIVQY